MHTPIENLRKSCPLRLRDHISNAIGQLKKEGLLLIKPTSHGQDVCALESKEGYKYANDYEREADLPLSKLGEPKRPIFKIPPLTDEQLRALKLRKKK